MAFPPMHGGSPGYRQHFGDALAGYVPGCLGLLSLTVFENDIKLLQVALIYVWIPSTVFLFSLSYSSVPRLRQALRHRDSGRTPADLDPFGARLLHALFLVTCGAACLGTRFGG